MKVQLSRWVFALGIFAVALSNGLTQDKAPPKLQTLQVPIPSISGSVMPYVVAKKVGYYREEGFDVDLIRVLGRIVIPGILSGDFQYTSSAAILEIGAILKGLPIKHLMGLTDRPSFDFVARAGINSFNDLKGKKIGGGSSVGSQPDEVIRAVLVKNGLVPDKDVQIIMIGATPERFGALKSGIVDATLLSDMSSFIAQDDGYKKLAYTGDFVRSLGMGVMITEERLKEKPDEVHRFIRATMKGLWYYRARKKESVAMQMEYLKITDPKVGENSYDFYLKGFTEYGVLDEQIMRDTIEYGKRIFKIPPEKEIKPSDVFNTTVVTRVRDELVAAKWKP
jgi:ABC-type nitrate/sulfonate/bicarbonate transport system substrate-binding protein